VIVALGNDVYFSDYNKKRRTQCCRLPHYAGSEGDY